MQLLVSVRSAAEARSALAGGADVIDAKEPAAGALGPVAPEILASLDAAVPGQVPVSAALGDVTTPAAAARLVAGLAFRGRGAPVYAKLALPEVPRSRWREVLCAAVRAGAEHEARVQIIAAGYADLMGAPRNLLYLVKAAAEADAAGVLLDTAMKNGKTLFDHVSVAILARYAELARAAGLLSGIAGSLTADQLPVVVAVGTDLVGVRGAVCEGGRAGKVDVRRVREVRWALGTSFAARPMAS